MNILVTGGAGFIGSHLVKRLWKEGHTVVVLDDLSGGTVANLPENSSDKVKFIKLSILEQGFLSHIFDKHKIEKCYHLGSYAAECLSPFIRNHNYSVNVVGSANIINCCINYGVKELIFTSSIAVYGRYKPIGLMWEEASFCQPSDPYGNAKLAVERDIQIAHEQHGLPFKIFRPHNVLGTHQHINDPFRNVVGIFIKCLLEGKPLPIFGDGEQLRQFTPVEYVVEGLVNPSVPWNQIYNIGSDQSYTIKNIAHCLSQIFGQGVLNSKCHSARHEAYHPKCDHSKIQAFIGKCEFDLMEELNKIVEWAKQDKGFQSILPRIEVELGMPEAWRQ